MHPARAFPPHLSGSAFHVSERDFHELTPGQLRSARLDAPFHGVRSLGLRREDALARARMYAPRLRAGQYYSHVTAAQLYGIPLPLIAERSTIVHVSAATGTRVRTRGAVGHIVRDLMPHSFAELPVVSPEQTWCHLASVISREYLVAAGDFLVSGCRIGHGGRTPPLCTRDRLADAVRRHGSKRGAVALGWALPLLRERVDSPRESMLRVTMVLSGLPEPVVAHAVRVAGERVLHPDLAYPEAKIAIEYEGDEHRSSKSRWRADLRRVALLEEAGWRVIRVTDDDLSDPTTFVRIVRAALASRLAQ